MTAPLKELRRAFPEAEIQVAVQTPWAPLFEGMPDIRRVWSYERRKETASRAKALASLALKLRRERFDAAFVFHASPSSATVAFATGAPIRSIHFHGHKDKNRYSTVKIPGKGQIKPVIERDMDALRAVGIHVPAGRLPSIQLESRETTAGKDFLERAGVRGPVLGIGLGASRPAKAWPIERYALLATRWARETGGGAFAVAASDESALLREFLARVDEILKTFASDPGERASLRSRITGSFELPIRQLAAVLGAMAVFAGNDSGPRHLAVAVETPTVTLFGPEDPFEWHPYPVDRHPLLFMPNLECRKDAMPGMPPWCARHECKPSSPEQHRCLRNIGVDEVLALCLKQVPASSVTELAPA